MPIPLPPIPTLPDIPGLNDMLANDEERPSGLVSLPPRAAAAYDRRKEDDMDAPPGRPNAAGEAMKDVPSILTLLEKDGNPGDSCLSMSMAHTVP